MHEEWAEKLSDYLDGELAGDERQAVESHLAGCAACTKVLEDLKRVVARAASIQPRPPAADLWTGIAARIDAPPARSGVTAFPGPDSQWRRMLSRRVSFSLPQRAAARSEEHTSELQSPDHLVCRLLLEKKKKSPDRFIG